MFRKFFSTTRARRRLRHLHNGPRVDDHRYRKIVIREEVHWYLIISAIILLPIALCFAVMHLENTLDALFNSFLLQ